MDHIGKKKKKINSCSALDQKEINSARTFHHLVALPQDQASWELNTR